MNRPTFKNTQLTVLVILRVAIGWHFLYEGFVKLLNPNWTAIGYLVDSRGLFSGLFQNMATHPGLLDVIDFLNIWGLILIGMGLMLGIFSKAATYAGMVLLLFYYCSHPPLLGVEYAMPSEGNYLIVNKNLILFLSLWILALFPTSHIIGLDRLIFNRNEKTMQE
ncbi:MAG: DoxX family membrane protein [Bacteroidales bacterium]|nr:DoxX family membrane protein [Bacteroidales bacterium]